MQNVFLRCNNQTKTITRHSAHTAHTHPTVGLTGLTQKSALPGWGNALDILAEKAEPN